MVPPPVCRFVGVVHSVSLIRFDRRDGAFLLRSVVNTSDVVSGGNVVALNAIASETL